VNAIGYVRGARAALLATLAGAALLWAGMLAGGLLLLVALTDLVVAVPFGARQLALPLAIVAAVAVAAVVLWLGRHARRLGRVALYLEERVPALKYSLITAIEPAGVPSASGLKELERAIARAEPRRVLRPMATKALALPFALLSAALATLILLPPGTLERVLYPQPGDILNRPITRPPLGNRLTPLVVRIDPPRYARQVTRTVDDPESVNALVGSRIDIRGRGASAGMADRISAVLGVEAEGGRDSLAVMVTGDTWSVPLRMPQRPTAVRLNDRTYDRLLILEPVIDEPPGVTLVSPARDTILPVGKGRLTLTAKLEDDIGLARAEFEVMHTSGGGERFQTRRSIVGRVGLASRRSATVQAVLLLDSMQLKPGDVLHIRAVTWDENDVTGPGRGESETRTIRVLDPREQYRVDINPARAAAIDTSILSQRMLILRAETLLVEKAELPADSFTQRSLQLSVRQGQLRGRVESIVFELENVQGVGFVGETPSSKILRQAAIKMQDAQTELSIVQVGAALPHMREALKLLERVRDANRYWLRGLLTSKPIEIEKIRLTGTDRASVGGRDPRRRAEDPRLALLARFDRAIPLVEKGEAAGRDSLRLILVAALTEAKDVAAPLGEALEAMRDGRDPKSALVQARRRLERRTEAEGALSSWRGAP